MSSSDDVSRAGPRLRGLRLVALALTLVASLLLALPRVGQGAVVPKRGASSEHPLATREALQQLRAGGNAVDAAITAALVAGVVAPSSSGIGGGGFALVYTAKDQQCHVLDFRERAPRAIDAAAFERRPFAFAERGRYVGVPGEVAGLYELHRRFGRRPWAKLVEPAVRLARSGYAVHEHLARSLAYSVEQWREDRGLASTFLRGKALVKVGSRVQNPRLGATLARIGAEGPSALYAGPIAADIVRSTQQAGGALSLQDLAEYAPVWRSPLRTRWEGYDICTMPPPSAGGLLLAQTLGLFSAEELRRAQHGSAQYIHLLAEGMRGALADRLHHVADPDLVPVDVAGLLAPERLLRRKRQIAPGRTHALPRFLLRDHGTHHLSVMDESGTAVSLTTTVNRAFGAKLTTERSGIVLNDELEDFSSTRDVAALGGRTVANLPRPLARPVSSMTPTVVTRDGRVVLALGGSGGMTIPTNVAQVLLNRLAFGMPPEEALAKSRFYVPTADVTLVVEQGSSLELQQDLAWRGELLRVRPSFPSAVQVMAVEDDGRVVGAADRRKFGSALVE